MDGRGSGERDGGDAGELARLFCLRLREGAGGGEGAGEEEAGEGAVDVAAGADALDDLLAEVAAFGEVQGAGLARWGGLLREFAVADVGAVAGRALEDAEVFDGFGGGRGSPASVRAGRASEGLGVRPDFEARDEGAVGGDDLDGGCMPGPRGLN